MIVIVLVLHYYVIYSISCTANILPVIAAPVTVIVIAIIIVVIIVWRCRKKKNNLKVNTMSDTITC